MAKATKAKLETPAEAHRHAIFDAWFAVAECEAKRPERAHRNGVHWNKGYSAGIRQALKAIKKLRKD